MTKLSMRLDKLEGVSRAGRLISVGVYRQDEVAPLLAKHGIELRPTDTLVTTPCPIPTLFCIDNQVFGSGHRLEEVLAERYADHPFNYDIRPMAAH